jgi:sec-independent protein translocase protein TatA
MIAQPAFGLPGGSEWILIFLVVLLVFGAKRLPEIARSLGKASKEFKKARREFSDVTNDVTNDITDDSTPAPAPKKTQAKAEPSETTTDDDAKDA